MDTKQNSVNEEEQVTKRGEKILRKKTQKKQKAKDVMEMQ